MLAAWDTVVNNTHILDIEKEMHGHSALGIWIFRSPSGSSDLQVTVENFSSSDPRILYRLSGIYVLLTLQISSNFISKTPPYVFSFLHFLC